MAVSEPLWASNRRVGTPMPFLGYNPSARRRSASQQGMALQGSPQPAAIPNTNSTQNPLFGRPGLSSVYQATVNTSQAGPILRGSVGSGNTGSGEANRSTGFIPGGSLDVQRDYQPQGLENHPLGSDTFTLPNTPPKALNLGTNGRELVGTYQPHDFTPLQRFINMWRSSYNWQVTGFGPNWRNLLIAQQVQKYNLYTTLAQSRPLSQQDYFVGYVTSPGVAGAAGAAGGYGGSLGYR